MDTTAHRIDDPAQIAAALEGLRAQAVTLTAYPPQGEPTPCRVLALDAGAGQLSLEGLAGAAPADGPTCFVTVHGQAKLQFSLPAQWTHEANQAPRLHAALPDELVRLQRRAFARLDAPVGRGFEASFTHVGQAQQFVVSDLSLGGVGLRAAPRQASLLRPGTRLRRVRLSLDDVPIAVVELEVRLHRPFRSYLLGPQVHVGCRFIDLAADAQAALAEAIAGLTR